MKNDLGFNKEDVLGFLYKNMSKAREAILEDIDKLFEELFVKYPFVLKDMRKIKYHATLMQNVFGRYLNLSLENRYNPNPFRWNLLSPVYSRFDPISIRLCDENYLMFLYLIGKSNFSIDAISESVVKHENFGKDVIYMQKANEQCNYLYRICTLFYKIKKSEEEYGKLNNSIRAMRSLNKMISFLNSLGFNTSEILKEKKVVEDEHKEKFNKNYLFTCHKPSIDSGKED